MRRAGYEVWIAYEEPGSYEEGPPNLSDMLTRDRRWCAGNLQHFWFLFARGIELGSRLQIWIGLMALPLLADLAALPDRQLLQRLRAHANSSRCRPARRTSSVASSSGAVVLFWITVALLFMPRVLGIVRALHANANFTAARGGCSPARSWKTCSPSCSRRC